MDGANVRVTLLKWIDPKKKNKAKWDDQMTNPNVAVRSVRILT